MPQEEIILEEKDRSKLDGIVNQMLQNNEADADIQFVVEDFKGKYGKKKKHLFSFTLFGVTISISTTVKCRGDSAAEI